MAEVADTKGLLEAVDRSSVDGVVKTRVANQDVDAIARKRAAEGVTSTGYNMYPLTCAPQTARPGSREPRRRNATIPPYGFTTVG